jgi:hypothetical protein
MERFSAGDIDVCFGAGRRDWRKLSYPADYGLFARITWRGFDFDFNLNGQLKWVGGKPPAWPDARERLKRTVANDYVYYAVFGYESARAMTGAYYVPYTGRDDPEVFNERPFDRPFIGEALSAFDALAYAARDVSEAPPTGSHPRAVEFLSIVGRNGRDALAASARRLRDIIGCSVPVLPPDAIEVDYEVVPLAVADGCAYQCGFCGFREPGFNVRSPENVRSQIEDLADFYGADLVNHNALLLAGNDALAAGAGAIERAACAAYERLHFARSYHDGARLFMFGSAGALLGADSAALKTLDSLPFESVVNVGLESLDGETLRELGKPLCAADAREALARAFSINSSMKRLRVSANFVVGDALPERHYDAIKEALCDPALRRARNVVYLAPLIGASPRRDTVRRLMEIKRASRADVFLYLFQRI